MNNQLRTQGTRMHGFAPVLRQTGNLPFLKKGRTRLRSGFLSTRAGATTVTRYKISRVVHRLGANKRYVLGWIHIHTTPIKAPRPSL